MNFKPSRQTFDAPSLDESLIAVVQQEVDLAGDALRRGKADVAVTLYQSALAKMEPSLPFYDHLAHNLLTAYKALIEQLLQKGEEETAAGFLESALSLQITGEMAADKT